MFALASLVFYVLALFLAVIFIGLLVVAPGTTLNVPDTVWGTEKKWAQHTALLYAAPIVGIIVFSVMIILFDDSFVGRLAAYAGGFVTVLLSYFIDRLRNSWPGVILDVAIGGFILLSLFFYLLS